MKTATIVFDDDDNMTFPQVMLQGLDKNGRACEICGSHMHDHDWATFDRNGFVVACSNQGE